MENNSRLLKLQNILLDLINQQEGKMAGSKVGEESKGEVIRVNE